MRDPQPRDAAVPKGPRASSSFRQLYFSHHNLLLYPSFPPTHSAGETPGTGRLGGGSWLPLGSQENALEARGHLSEQRKLQVVSPGLRP